MSSPAVFRVGTCIIPTQDVDAAIAFYTGPLAMEKRVDIPFGGQYRWVEVAPPGADTTIAIAPPPEGQSAGGRSTGVALHSTDLDALHAQLKEAGVDVDEEIARMGDPVPPMFWFRDPEQNVLMVVGVPADAVADR